MIEEHYLMKIWQVIGLKENQNLSPEQMQDKIRVLLLFFKEEVYTDTQKEIKRKLIYEFTTITNCL